MRRRDPLALGLLTALLILGGAVGIARGFTQYAGRFEITVVPMGHEWLTRLAALELLGGDPIDIDRRGDPRPNWTRGLAKNPRLDANVARAIRADRIQDARYESAYQAVFAAVVGQRWVDIGGFNVLKEYARNPPGQKANCWAAIPQEAEHVQYDHYMRRWDDHGPAGGINAAEKSVEQFKAYFVAAATAEPGVVKAWDGGGFSAAVVVDRNYFLFGRAVHLFQDSFSPDHTVRIVEDNFEKVRQVKAYHCSTGAEQHYHGSGAPPPQSGDVIWRPGTRQRANWSGYTPANMKLVALVATEATKDLWAAFIRTMGTPPAGRAEAAKREAAAVAKHWLEIDAAGARTWYQSDSRRDDSYVRHGNEPGKGRTVKACLQSIKVEHDTFEPRRRELAEARRYCLFNVRPEAGYSDRWDTQLQMPFHWAWKDSEWQTPPDNWPVPPTRANTGARVTIRNVAVPQQVTAPDGIEHTRALHVGARGGGPGSPVLTFVVVGSRQRVFLRLDSHDLFLSYGGVSGGGRLWHNANEADFELVDRGSGRVALRSLRHNQYLHAAADGGIWLNRHGNPNDPSGQWILEGLPPNWGK